MLKQHIEAAERFRRANEDITGPISTVLAEADKLYRTLDDLPANPLKTGEGGLRHAYVQQVKECLGTLIVSVSALTYDAAIKTHQLENVKTHNTLRALTTVARGSKVD